MHTHTTHIRILEHGIDAYCLSVSPILLFFMSCLTWFSITCGDLKILQSSRTSTSWPCIMTMRWNQNWWLCRAWHANHTTHGSEAHTSETHTAPVCRTVMQTAIVHVCLEPSTPCCWLFYSLFWVARCVAQLEEQLRLEHSIIMTWCVFLNALNMRVRL